MPRLTSLSFTATPQRNRRFGIQPFIPTAWAASRSFIIGAYARSSSILEEVRDLIVSEYSRSLTVLQEVRDHIVQKETREGYIK